RQTKAYKDWRQEYEHTASRIDARRKQARTPAAIERQRANDKKRQLDAAQREKRRLRTQEYNRRPEIKERRRRQYRELMKDPTYRAKRLERNRLWNQNPVVREKQRAWRLMNTYGLTIEQYNIMLQQQNYCCAICDEPLDLNKTNVDH